MKTKTFSYIEISYSLARDIQFFRYSGQTFLEIFSHIMQKTKNSESKSRNTIGWNSIMPAYCHMQNDQMTVPEYCRFLRFGHKKRKNAECDI